MLQRIWRLPFAAALAVALAHGGEGAPKPEYALHGATDKPVAIYQADEDMVFTLKVLEDGKPVAGKKIWWQRSGDDGAKDAGEARSTEEGVKIKLKTAKPGFVRLQAWAFSDDGKKLQGFCGGWGPNKYGAIFFDGGACVAPEKLTSTEEPADFDEFWKGMKAELAAVPMKADLKELDWKFKDKVKLYAVKIDCAGPRPVTGYLTVPVGAKEKSLKAVLSFHGYGTGKHGRPGWGDPNAIRFDVNAHGMELEQNDEYYKKLGASLANYALKDDENKDAKKAYFHGMALRLLRAFEYVKSMKEWNGRELESNGGSQGGLQGLWGAALVPEVTSADIWSPWCCDLGGINVGRQRGWRPNWFKALDYYDPAFMAKRIKNARVHLIANYGDYTCPPSSVWIVYNNLATSKKSMEVKQGCTHSYQMKNFQSYVITPEGTRDAQVKK